MSGRCSTWRTMVFSWTPEFGGPEPMCLKPWDLRAQDFDGAVPEPGSRWATSPDYFSIFTAGGAPFAKWIDRLGDPRITLAGSLSAPSVQMTFSRA